jgi:hypothetical protein
VQELKTTVNVILSAGNAGMFHVKISRVLVVYEVIGVVDVLHFVFAMFLAIASRAVVSAFEAAFSLYNFEPPILEMLL